MGKSILIKGGRVIDPASGLDGIRDIFIRDGKIERIIPQNEPEKKASGNDPGNDEGENRNEENRDELNCDGPNRVDEIIDASGMVISPGFVDVHVHFRDPGFTQKEDIFTGARSAAKGGYTSVVMMANTNPTIDNTETLKYVLEKGKQTDINIYACANVTIGMKGETLTDMETLAKAGAVGFTDDGIPLVKEEIVLEAMKRSKALGMPLSFHEEDPSVIENNGINRGKASEYFGIGGSPRQAEINMVSRDIELAKKTGAIIDIQHISTKEGVELVRQAKAAGVNIHAEATPHHFSLTEEAAIEHGTLAKMNPPLREEADRQAIVRGLADGTIDMIATDHAPHTAEEKSREITKAPSGIIGLETALPLAIEYLVDSNEMKLQDVLAVMSTNPAKLYKLDAGYIKAGGPADLCIFDPEAAYIYTKESIASKACNSPFIGKKMTGKVCYTICRGKIVYSAD